MITYDYLQPNNNCFLIRHDNNFYLDDYVESVNIDSTNNSIRINYHENTDVKLTDKIILEVYNRFGILANTQVFDNLSCIEKTDDYVIYKFES